MKPTSERGDIDSVLARLRRKLGAVAGARLFLQAGQDLRIGGKQSNAAYQYTLQADNSATLYEWGPKLTAALEHDPALADVNSDQQQKGLETDILIDRATASRLGVSASQIDNTLYDAFGQRQVSTIYSGQNQYHVIMEVAPRYWQNPETLHDIFVSTSGGNASGSESTNAVVGTVGSASSTAASSLHQARHAMHPATLSPQLAKARLRPALLSAQQGDDGADLKLCQVWPGTTPLGINHQGLFVATTISFNLARANRWSDADAAVAKAVRDIRMPASITGSFAGAAQTFQASLDSEPVLIGAALLAVYIVLGVLYESFIHPITIISTLPSASVGAMLALMLFKTDFSIIALIGVILLIGIVRKTRS